MSAGTSKIARPGKKRIIITGTNSLAGGFLRRRTSEKQTESESLFKFASGTDKRGFEIKIRVFVLFRRCSNRSRPSTH